MTGLSRSTYYGMKFRLPSDGEIRRLLLADAITEIHARSRGTYGVLRIRAALEIEQGLIVNTKLVLKLMRQLGIHGLPGPKKGVRNLVNAATQEDLVQRNFTASYANALWLTDITEHPTREGKVYCCAVLDLYTRKVVGWAIDRRCESALVNDALAMAGGSRCTASRTVIHSDHGTQGEFIRCSQHLVRGVGENGRWKSSCRSSCLSGTDPLTGPSVGRVARGSSSILGGDRTRVFDGRCLSSVEHLVAGRLSVVPSRWWGESQPSSHRVRSLPLVHGARGHRALARPRRRRERDRAAPAAFTLNDLA